MELETQTAKALTPGQVFMACFAISSIAGLANLLRTTKAITLRAAMAATLYSGLFGLVIGLVWHNYFAPTNQYFLIGVSGLSGLGGMSLIDLIVQLFLNGINIKITLPSEDEEDSDE